VPVLGKRLAPGALVVVDDAEHMSENLDAWLASGSVELLTRNAQVALLRATGRR
jgi:hypothetical protein